MKTLKDKIIEDFRLRFCDELGTIGNEPVWEIDIDSISYLEVENWLIETIEKLLKVGKDTVEIPIRGILDTKTKKIKWLKN